MTRSPPPLTAGIIPARAGFTLGRWFWAARRGDHPRSRGVYAGRRETTIGTRGSSPLARGLRSRARALIRPIRIIPARAGFTKRGTENEQDQRDHPRSRGVYPGPPATWAGRCGSSPLARGLPVTGVADGGRTGIIPARAGFTRCCRGRRRSSGDHPRSRGVYPGRPTAGDAARGSSPLALGLPLVAASIACSIGIIPARAGFTCPLRFHVKHVRDHPRSRGVYARWWTGAGSG